MVPPNFVQCTGEVVTTVRDIYRDVCMVMQEIQDLPSKMDMTTINPYERSNLNARSRHFEEIIPMFRDATPQWSEGSVAEGDVLQYGKTKSLLAPTKT